MVDIVSPVTVLSNVRLVAVAGTQVTLGVAATRIRTVVIKALVTNTGNIYVGGATVSAADGYVLDAGDVLSLSVTPLTAIWIDADVGGEGVSYIAVV